MQRDFGEKEKKKNNLEIFYEAQSALSIFTCQFYSLISSNEFSYSLCSLKAGASAAITKSADSIQMFSISGSLKSSLTLKV